MDKLLQAYAKQEEVPCCKLFGSREDFPWPENIFVMSRFRILVSRLRSSTSARDAEPVLVV